MGIWRVVLAVVLLSPSCFIEPSRIHPKQTLRILGGKPANIAEFPFLVAFEIKLKVVYQHYAGGTILGHFWVITGAHCVYGFSQNKLRIRSGTSLREQGGEVHNIDKIFIHPLYKGEEVDYDIALVKVSNRFHFGNAAQPVKLAHNPPPANTPVMVIGWGALITDGKKPSRLQKVEVNIMDFQECQRRYHGLFEITSRMLCAMVPKGGKDACEGDSGGPLVAKNEMVGIVSWSDEVCGNAYYPGVYTNVASFINWISNITEINII